MSANPYLFDTVKCAGPNCDAVRLQANHWFVCSRTKFGVAPAAFVSANDGIVSVFVSTTTGCSRRITLTA